MKLTMGGRQIAHFNPLRDRWVLRRGARLFVDETKLPRPGDLAGISQQQSAAGRDAANTTGGTEER